MWVYFPFYWMFYLFMFQMFSPFLVSSSQKPPIPFSLPLLPWLCSSTHYTPTSPPSIPLHWGIYQAFLGPSTSPPIDAWQGRPLLHMHPCVLLGWWLNPWLVDVVVLPMRLQTPSAPSVLSLSPPSGTPCSDAWLAESIRRCVWEALAGPLRRRPYQDSFSKRFLASIMPVWLCVGWIHMWATSGRPFPQSLL